MTFLEKIAKKYYDQYGNLIKDDGKKGSNTGKGVPIGAGGVAGAAGLGYGGYKAWKKWGPEGIAKRVNKIKTENTSATPFSTTKKIIGANVNKNTLSESQKGVENAAEITPNVINLSGKGGAKLTGEAAKGIIEKKRAYAKKAKAKPGFWNNFTQGAKNAFNKAKEIGNTEIHLPGRGKANKAASSGPINKGKRVAKKISKKVLNSGLTESGEAAPKGFSIINGKRVAKKMSKKVLSSGAQEGIAARKSAENIFKRFAKKYGKKGVRGFVNVAKNILGHVA